MITPTKKGRTDERSKIFEYTHASEGNLKPSLAVFRADSAVSGNAILSDVKHASFHLRSCCVYATHMAKERETKRCPDRKEGKEISFSLVSLTC